MRPVFGLCTEREAFLGADSEGGGDGVGVNRSARVGSTRWGCLPAALLDSLTGAGVGEMLMVDKRSIDRAGLSCGALREGVSSLLSDCGVLVELYTPLLRVHWRHTSIPRDGIGSL